MSEGSAAAVAQLSKHAGPNEMNGIRTPDCLVADGTPWPTIKRIRNTFFVSKPAKCTTWIWLFITKGDYVMRMKNPPHPGRIVRQECIEPLGLTETAKRLGVMRQVLNNW